MGYGRRVKNSFFGAIFGIIMCIASIVLMGWNERDAVRQTGAITEIEGVAMADVPSDAVDSANDGKLVHMNATAETDEVLEFQTFGVRENAIRLRWDTSIYQWKEKKKREDDRDRYTYSKTWVDQPIDSSRFRRQSGHSNDGSEKSFRDGMAEAKTVNFGAFHLSQKLISQIKEEAEYPLPDAIAMDVRPQGFVRNGVFQTGTPEDPQIGDERVEVFMVGPKHEATVMATQRENSFAYYETKVGIAKEILYVGTLTKPEVIGRQRTEAAIKRWILRGLGFILFWFGSALALTPIRAIVSFIPFTGRILDGAIGFVTFLLAAIVATVVIGIAWFVVRPILTVVLFAVAATALFFLYRQKSPGGDAGERFGPPPLPT